MTGDDAISQALIDKYNLWETWSPSDDPHDRYPYSGWRPWVHPGYRYVDDEQRPDGSYHLRPVPETTP